MRVLIVDDCQLSTEMLAIVLEVYGHEVRQTLTPIAALGVAADFHPDLVLLQVASPVAACERETARRLRSLTADEPRVCALCSEPQALSGSEERLFDQVFPRPVRFGQLKPFLEADPVKPRLSRQRLHSA